MKKTRLPKKLTTLAAAGALVVCMSAQAFAATVPAVEIWKPDTAYQTTSPNTVYMDYDDTSDWNTNGEHLEKISWKFFKKSFNPDITTTGDCIAKQYVNNDDSNDLAYSYAFDANDIDQNMVKKQPYYLGIKTESSNNIITATMGCRTKFPVAMDVTIHTDFAPNTNVTVAYATGSCDGYAACKATNWSQIQNENCGDSNYLDGFANTFTTSSVTVDANGCVTFTTYHGGEYYIY